MKKKYNSRKRKIYKLYTRSRSRSRSNTSKLKRFKSKNKLNNTIKKRTNFKKYIFNGGLINLISESEKSTKSDSEETTESESEKSTKFDSEITTVSESEMPNIEFIESLLKKETTETTPEKETTIKEIKEICEDLLSKKKLNRDLFTEILKKKRYYGQYNKIGVPTYTSYDEDIIDKAYDKFCLDRNINGGKNIPILST